MLSSTEMSKKLKAPKQITMDNPLSPGVSPNRGQTPVIESIPPESSDPDPRCICCLYVCFFLPGCIAACADCAH